MRSTTSTGSCTSAACATASARSPSPSTAAQGTHGRARLQGTPCVLGRFLVVGNVKDTPLDEILTSERWREILAVVQPRDTCVTCSPADSNDCGPSKKPK